MSKIKKAGVYLPQSARWIDFWTGQTLEGGQTLQHEVPVDIMPICVRTGSILPWGTTMQYSMEKKQGNLTIHVYPGASAEFTLYKGEFSNYNYEKGAYSTITLRWNDQDRTLIIDDRGGNYKGMLKSCKFDLIVVEPGKGCGDGDLATFDKSISYRGKKVIAKL